MKPFQASLVAANVAIMAGVAAGALMAPASAAPPTVVPSPGYDARLQEQRAAQSSQAPVVVEPVVHPAGPAPRRHVKRTHAGAH
jgi:hypothetical protein